MMTRLNPDAPSPTPSSRAPATYVGIFFVALATLMYEILLTRIFSVTMLYHFAFVALSLAMFGMTAGALLVYLAPRLFPPERLRHRLAACGGRLSDRACVLSFLTELSIPFRVGPVGRRDLRDRASPTSVIAVPFVVSGIAICLVLTGFPRAGQPALRRRSRRRGARLRAPDRRRSAGPTGRPPCSGSRSSRASAASAFASDAGSRRLRRRRAA